METVVNKQLMAYLTRHHVLSDSQYGFRQGRGTADVLTALQSEWVQTIATDGCAPVVAVDIAGEFDRVSHPGIIHEAQQTGVKEPLLTWLQSYLADRYLQVAVGGSISSKAPTSAGVPQGSVLGPTLFLLYVADIDQCLAPGSQLRSLADDTTLYAIAATPEDLNLPVKDASLQSTLNNLASWGRQCHVRFEPAKSQLDSSVQGTQSALPTAPHICRPRHLSHR